MPTGYALQRERVLWRDGGLCQLRNLGVDHACSGLPQCAHIPPKQALRNFRRDLALRQRAGKPLSASHTALLAASYEEVSADPRGAVTMCEKGHNNFDLLGKRGQRDLLPEHIREFVSDYGLEPLLDRLYGTTNGGK